MGRLVANVAGWLSIQPTSSACQASHFGPHYHAGMTSRSLSRQQVDGLERQIRRQVIYYNRLTARMFAERFPQDDPLRIEAFKAREAIQKLHDMVQALVQAVR